MIKGGEGEKRDWERDNSIAWCTKQIQDKYLVYLICLKEWVGYSLKFTFTNWYGILYLSYEPIYILLNKCMVLIPDDKMLHIKGRTILRERKEGKEEIKERKKEKKGRAN